jgi:hypothetical protein
VCGDLLKRDHIGHQSCDSGITHAVDDSRRTAGSKDSVPAHDWRFRYASRQLFTASRCNSSIA